MTQQNRPKHSAKSSDWPVRFISWARAELHKYLSPLAPIVIAVWGVLDRDTWAEHLWVLGVGIIVGVLGVVIRPRKPTYSQLKIDYDHLQLRFNNRGDAVQRSLETLLEKLAIHCGINTHQDRVSAYYYHNATFVMVGRYSKNPEHRKEGRRIYPVKQGIIGKAWESPKGVFQRKFSADKHRWFEEMMDHGLTRDEAQTLTMRSLIIAAFRVEDNSGSVGALVIESTVQNRINAETLSYVDNSLVYSAIADFIGASSVESPKVIDTGAGEPSSLFNDEWKPAALSHTIENSSR